ncbi:MAG TPA: DUF1015 family protein [Vicinamibacterales bacterium]|nr:DUF1015 family protein [Vicinamibacterales bacterium]
MAALVPFRALRPAATSAARVAAVPYDVVNTSEARALASDNPLSFLHVSRAEIDLPDGASPYADAVYARAAANFDRLRQQAPLVMEDAPRLYVYRLRMGRHSQTGLAACFSVDEYERRVILRHEHTRPDKEDDRTRHLLTLGAQTGPVFLTYRARPAVDGLVERVTTTTPVYDFTAIDGVQHTIWLVGAAEERQIILAFDAIPALYIADGHHRAASAARARRTLAGAAHATGEWDWFLAVAFPDSEVQILPYNRVIADLAGMTPAAFLDALRARALVQSGPAEPQRRGEVAMFLQGSWHTIVLPDAPAAVSPADRLDVTRLQATVLEPLLRIGDVRTDKRIDFVGGVRGTAELEARVRSGVAALAFSMFPVDAADLMAIADAGGIMPPKSTWFEPKLRDGLLSHVIS